MKKSFLFALLAIVIVSCDPEDIPPKPVPPPPAPLDAEILVNQYDTCRNNGDVWVRWEIKNASSATLDGKTIKFKDSLHLTGLTKNLSLALAAESKDKDRGGKGDTKTVSIRVMEPVWDLFAFRPWKILKEEVNKDTTTNNWEVINLNLCLLDDVHTFYWSNIWYTDHGVNACDENEPRVIHGSFTLTYTDEEKILVWGIEKASIIELTADRLVLVIATNDVVTGKPTRIKKTFGHP